MSEQIQRYVETPCDEYAHYLRLDPGPGGEWVTFDDHTRFVQHEREEAMKAERERCRKEEVEPLVMIILAWQRRVFTDNQMGNDSDMILAAVRERQRRSDKAVAAVEAKMKETP
jgi:hypothetical protein